MAHPEVVFSLSHSGSREHSDGSEEVIHYPMDDAEKHTNDNEHSSVGNTANKRHKDSVSRLKHPTFTTPRGSLQHSISPMLKRRLSPNPSMVPPSTDPRYIERRATIEAINAFAASLDRTGSGSEDYLHLTADIRSTGHAPMGSFYDIHNTSPGDTIHSSSGHHHSDIRLHQLVRNASHAESIASNATMNLARRLRSQHGILATHGSMVRHSGDSALGSQSHPAVSMEEYYQAEAPLLPTYSQEHADGGKDEGEPASPKASLTDKILFPYKKGMHHCSAYIPNIVTINVCGKRFQTTYETLAKYPNTLLGKPELRDRYWNPIAEEYFFNRHRGSFEAILYMYLSNGVLIRPRKVSLEVFHEELRFFRIPEEIMIQFWRREGFRIKHPPRMPSSEFLKTLWLILEYPNSSTLARGFAIFSILIILVACISFIIETVPGVQHAISGGSPTGANRTPDHDSTTEHREHKAADPFHIIEILCISWFTIELLLKFIACPAKTKFIQSLATWIDILAIAPFYITLLFPQTRYSEVSMGFALLRVIRLLHIFQILKISRYSRGLTTLSLTFAAGCRELLLLGFVLLLLNIIFASGIYIAEYETAGSTLKSLPEAMWYGVITMTTVGYGDYIPQTAWGRFIGSICALCGLLVISLPIPVIVKNFKHFYRQEVQLQHVNDLIVKESDKVKLTVCHDNWLKKD